MTGSAPREPAPLIGGKRTNPTPIPEVVAIMQGLCAKRPGVDMNALMRSEKLGIAEIRIGGKGTCLNFMYIGKCARAGCSYDQCPARNVLAGKRRDRQANDKGRGGIPREQSGWLMGRGQRDK